MKTFCIQTLGCKVNQYESEQIASLLRIRGWAQSDPDQAELRIINTCSVTVQAASQSRQAVRRLARLPVVSPGHPSNEQLGGNRPRPRVLVTGCWATSDRQEALRLAGVDAVLTHHDDIAAELDRLLAFWQSPPVDSPAGPAGPHHRAFESPPRSMMDDGWTNKAGTTAGKRTTDNKPKTDRNVNDNPATRYQSIARHQDRRGTSTLPLLGEHQTERQRAFLKVQDGCDAHCTYCIIPRLRSTLHSKPIDDAVEEARRLVACGHGEIVLTGIFLGAYGQSTALRRRQGPSQPAPLAQLVEALCTKVTGLKRLRLSSLEPGDLTDDLVSVLASHEQVVPHLHLPLQSGSETILRRMNRQYTRDDFLRTLERVATALDRPALTTDVIVGFPGETDDEFDRTLEVVDRVKFIYVHAFPFSARPGTAAARWTGQFIHGPVVNDRIELLRERVARFSLEFRAGFVGQIAQAIVERDASETQVPRLRHGRCERYFPVWFDAPDAREGQAVRVRIERVTPTRTFGIVE